jgi:hypothetical protein
MSDSRTRVLQQPRILVENQKTATFTVGQKIPFFTGGSIGTVASGNTTTLTPSQPVQQLLTVGLDLEITPVINNNGLVEMEVSVRNNSPLFSNVIFAGANYTGVGSNNQELQTTLLIPSGETRVIGGLVSDRKNETRSGIPGLYRIPVIGPALFGSISRPADDNRRTNLLIFLTPAIVAEKGGDLLKYKGRVTMNDEESYTTPTATLSDYSGGPALLPDKTSYGDLPPVDLGTPGLRNSVPPVEIPVETAPPTTLYAPTEEQQTIRTESQTTLDTAAPGTMTELRKIHIDESALASTDSLRSLLPRVPAPSGALSGTASSTQQAGAAPPTGVVPPTGGKPAVATPGIFQQPGSASATTIINNPPAVNAGGTGAPGNQPVTPQAPGPETRMR